MFSVQGHVSRKGHLIHAHLDPEFVRFEIPNFHTDSCACVESRFQGRSASQDVS